MGSGGARWPRSGGLCVEREEDREGVEKSCERVMRKSRRRLFHALFSPLFSFSNPRRPQDSHTAHRTCLPFDAELLPEPDAFVVFLLHQTSAATAAATNASPASEPPESGAAVFSLFFVWLLRDVSYLIDALVRKARE